MVGDVTDEHLTWQRIGHLRAESLQAIDCTVVNGRKYFESCYARRAGATELGCEW